MKKIYLNVACAGMDVHYKFSNVTFRDRSGKVVRRQRLDHRLRHHIALIIKRLIGDKISADHPVVRCRQSSPFLQ